MKYTIIIFIVFFIFILYYLIHKYLHKLKEQKNNPIFLWDAKSCKRPEIIEAEKFPESTTGDGYSISFWLWLDDTNINLRKKDKKWLHILHKGDPFANQCQPGIWIHPEKNDLYTFFDLKRTPSNYTPLKPLKFLRDNLDKKENIKLGELKKLCNNDELCTAISYMCVDSKNPCSDCKYGWLKKDDDMTLISTPQLIPGLASIEQANNIKNIKNSTTEFADRNKTRLMDIINMGYKDAGTIIKQINKPSMNPNTNKNLIYQKHTVNNVENVPLGRWFQFAIVVDSQATTIYIDGLVASIMTIASDIKMNKNNLYINTLNEGFPGLISQIKYFPYSISQNKIATIYKWGPNPWKLPDITNFKFRCRKYLFKGKYVNINGKKIFDLLGYGKGQSFFSLKKNKKDDSIRYYISTRKVASESDPTKPILRTTLYKVDLDEPLGTPFAVLSKDPTNLDYPYFKEYIDMMRRYSKDKREYDLELNPPDLELTEDQLINKINENTPENQYDSFNFKLGKNGKLFWNKGLLLLLSREMRKKPKNTKNDSIIDDTGAIDYCPEKDGGGSIKYTFPKPLPKPPPPSPYSISSITKVHEVPGTPFQRTGVGTSIIPSPKTPSKIYTGAEQCFHDKNKAGKAPEGCNPRAPTVLGCNRNNICDKKADGTCGCRPDRCEEIIANSPEEVEYAKSLCTFHPHNGKVCEWKDSKCKSTDVPINCTDRSKDNCTTAGTTDGKTCELVNGSCKVSSYYTGNPTITKGTPPFIGSNSGAGNPTTTLRSITINREIPSTLSLTDLRAEFAKEYQVPIDNIIITDTETGLTLDGINMRGKSINFEVKIPNNELSSSIDQTENDIRLKISQKFNIPSSRIIVTHMT